MHFCYFHSIQLDVQGASKVKNSLSQSIYERLFEHIVGRVNENSLSATTGSALMQINLLDIAGFGNC